ncbi:MAG: hypothetical protein SWY16_19535 [Cyanobacteriota bacterium]|nr:hypothetical protein [Cyanobacteriota bacterium]
MWDGLRGSVLNFDRTHEQLKHFDTLRDAIEHVLRLAWIIHNREERKCLKLLTVVEFGN